MAVTTIRSLQLKDGAGVNIDDLDITTSGKSVIAKLAVGNGLTISSSTGADSGTGVVTVKVSDALSLVTSLTSPIVYGSASSGGTLTLYSTSHATKGKILFGASAYDEVNDRIGIGNTTPLQDLMLNNGKSIGLHNITPDATNYERLRIYYTGNVATIASEAGGTGTSRAVSLISTNSTNTSTLTVQRASLPFLSWALTSATGSAGNQVTITAKGSASTGSQVAMAITPTWTQSSTAAATTLLLNPTETSVGSGSQLFLDCQVSSTSYFTIDTKGQVVLTQKASTTGSPTALTVTGAAHTSLTASTEASGVKFAMNRTVQFSTGALTTQREILIQAPTYAFVGASTLTDAATVEIAGAPKAGTNATITRPWALRITDLTGSPARVGIIATTADATLAISTDGSAYMSQLLFQDLNTTKYTIKYDGTSSEVDHLIVAGVNYFLGITSGANLSLTSAGNVGLWGSTFGTSAVKVLALTGTTGTLPSVEPTTSPADVIQIWAKDGATGACELYIRNEAGRVKRMTGDFCSVTSDFSKTSSTTLSDVTGLSFNVEAGKTYAFEAHLFLDESATVAMGCKVSIGGTATATTFIGDYVVNDNGTIYPYRVTSLGSTAATITITDSATPYATLSGTIVVNAAGTLTVQVAQGSSNANALKVKTGSFFRLLS